jgi:phosphatidylinositol kinase/protein kinase (PI-3  family)
VYRSWELDKVRYYNVQELGAGQMSDISIFTGAGNWTKVRYNSVQELRTGQGQILQCTGAGNWTRSDITVYRSWELDKGQILECRRWELDKVRYYSVQELRTGQRSDITIFTGAGNWTRSDNTVYRSWELDKVRYYNVQELGAGQMSDITIFTGAGNWTKVRYNSVQELRTIQGQILQCTGAGNWTRSDITVYRSWELDKGQILQCRRWELDKVRYYSVQELGTGQGQILQCTGAGNWTKVRYYSVQELRTGQRSDITVYRSQELDKCQILQGAGNWTRSDITVYRS